MRMFWAGSSFYKCLSRYNGFPGDSVVKNLSANAGDQFRSLVQEDPLKKEMTTYSSILAWEIPRTKEPGRLQSMGLEKSQTGLRGS